MKKILIVDDDEDIVRLIKNRLEKHNYKVLSSSDGEKGFKDAIEFQPDLIIMDIMMPNLSGGEAVKLLKSDDHTKQIPILFFTALATNAPDDTELAQINVNGQLLPGHQKTFLIQNKLLSTIKLLNRLIKITPDHKTLVFKL